MQRLSRSIATLDLPEVLQWCKKYHRYNKFPMDAYMRFVTGHYQLYQALEWANTSRQCDAAYESFIATILHWMGFAEELGVAMEQHLDHDFFKGRVQEYVSCEEFIIAHSKVAQMVLYHYAGNRTSRGRSRFSAERLGVNLAICIRFSFQHVPQAKIIPAMQDAMDVMTGAL
jgi:hypothetical protein